MEYVEVRYGQTRNVFIDGVESGETNKILRVGPGTHSFDLGEPKDFKPEKVILVVENTDPLEPLLIEFEEKTS